MSARNALAILSRNRLTAQRIKPTSCDVGILGPARSTLAALRSLLRTGELKNSASLVGGAVQLLGRLWRPAGGHTIITPDLRLSNKCNWPCLKSAENSYFTVTTVTLVEMP